MAEITAKLPELVDTHCHLDFEVFHQDRAQVLSLSRQKGITRLVIPGVDPLQWASAQTLSAALGGVFFAVGIHPWWVARNAALDDDAIERALCASMHDQRCVAIGETGLDGGIDCAMLLQERFFLAHIRLALRESRPLIVHCVKANNAVLQCLDKVYAAKRFVDLADMAVKPRGVIHAFSGSAALAKEFYRRGFLLGIGGTVTYLRAKKTRETLQTLPPFAFVLETDAPDMPLAGRQGERNSPAYLNEIAQSVAEIRRERLQDVARCTTENAARLFSWHN